MPGSNPFFENRCLAALVLVVISLVSNTGTGAGPCHADTSRFSMPELPALDRPGRQFFFTDTIVINRFIIQGNSVFKEETLQDLISEFKDRPVTAEDLQVLKTRLTRHYIDHGYINSGVILPQQPMDNGEIRLEIVEGRLTKIRLSADTDRKQAGLLAKLERGIGFGKDPLNIFKLQTTLKLINLDPHIETIHARLIPGPEKGTAELDVTLSTGDWFEFSIAGDNHHSPAIGAYGAAAETRLYNLTTFGDELVASFEKTEGMEKYTALFLLPLNSWYTTLLLESEGAWTEVVSEPFNELDITGRAATYSLAIRQPLFRSLAWEFALQAKLEHQFSKTYLFDTPFSFSRGAVDGESRMTVFELAQEWIRRGRTHAAVIRSGFNFGLDMLDATMGDAEPDGRCFFWTGEAQWIQSLPWQNSRVKLRFNAQWSEDSLLSLEKFTIGGHDTVRGYRENLVTADSGAIASIEWRIPVASIRPPFLPGHEPDGTLSLSLFSDAGMGRDKNGETSRLYSVGAGIRWALTKDADFEIYFAHGLKSVDLPKDEDLQDDGIHFRFHTVLF